MKAHTPAMEHMEERDVITVLLDRRDEHRSWRPFYCCKCGLMVCEILGDASVLVPGLPNAVELPAVGAMVLCRGYYRKKDGSKVRCDAKYVF